jgi:hypothetical protein
LYTLYTAKLHEDGDGSEVALNRMARLMHEDKPVRVNQYLFKAVLIDAMMQMQ